MKDLWELNKGKILIGLIAILVGFAGHYGGIEVTSKDGGGVCIGQSEAGETQ